MLALSPVTSGPHNAYLEVLEESKAAAVGLPHSSVNSWAERPILWLSTPCGLQEDTENRMAFRSLSLGQKEGNQKRSSRRRPWARLWQGSPIPTVEVTSWVKPRRLTGGQ